MRVIKWMVDEMKPWVTIWHRPRETIRGFLDGVDNPRLDLIFILYIGVLAVSSYRGIGPIIFDGTPFNVIVSVLVWVSIEIWFLSLIYKWAARLFGGQASGKQIRIAVLWYKVPYIILLTAAIGVRTLIPGGWPDNKIAINSILAAPGAAPPGEWVVMMLFVLVFSWRLFILSSGLAEVNDFPTWKGAAVWAIPWLVMGLVLRGLYMLRLS